MNGLRGVSRKVPRKTVTLAGHDVGPRRPRARRRPAARPRPRPRSSPAPCRRHARAARSASRSGRRPRPGTTPAAAPEPRPLGRRADQPDRAEVVAAQRGVDERDVLGVVVGHHQHVGAGRQLAQHQLGEHRHVVDVHRGDRVGERRELGRRSSCAGRESTRCRSRSWRARIRASSRPTWPTPKIATDGTTASGSSSTVTSPPQHCTPCSNGALSDRFAVNGSGATAPDRSSSRARRTASASRLPPPIEAQVAWPRRPSWRRPRAARGRARRSPSPARRPPAPTAARPPPANHVGHERASRGRPDSAQ